MYCDINEDLNILVANFEQSRCYTERKCMCEFTLVTDKHMRAFIEYASPIKMRAVTALKTQFGNPSRLLS